MARVTTVKKARVDQGTCFRSGCNIEIKAGAKYHWFSNLTGPRSSVRKVFCEIHYPKPSEITTSDKLSQIYSAQEVLEESIQTAGSTDDLVCALREAADQATEVGEAYRESVSNLPENLQNGSGADEMNEKADNCDSWSEALTNAADEIEQAEPEDEDKDVADGKEEDEDATAEAFLERMRTVASDAAGEMSL